MNKIIILIFTIVAFKTNAQVKVGSNPTTINSNANIQVESASGQQFIITSDSTKVGIGTLVPSSTLDVKGSMSVKYNAVSSTSYSVNSKDYYLLYNGTANTTFTLPAGTLSTCNCSGRAYEIINSSGFNITLNANTSELIQNANNLTILPGKSLKIVNNGNPSGNTWNVVNYTLQENIGSIPTQILSVNVSGTQNVANGTSILSFPIENFDSYNSWNGSEYIIPQTGNYQFTFQSLNQHTVGGGTWFIGTNIEVFKSGTWNALMGDVRSGLQPGDGSNSTAVTVSTNLNQGEKIRLRSFCNSTTDNIIGLGSLVITKL